MKNNVTTLDFEPHFVNADYPAFLTHRVEQYYRERVNNTWAGGNIMRGKLPTQNDIHLMSNDYLAIAQHEEIVHAAATSLLKNGSGVLMSGVFLHGDNPQLKFEQRLARFMRSESGVLCQSGWCANTGLIQSIANVETPVYVDLKAHASLWEGVKSAGAKAVMFHHNDARHLERQILKYGPGVVIVDSVYSIDGSVCPLKEIVAVANTHNCVMVVDESHSLGTHGPNGAGLVVALGLTDKVHFRTASLAKAFAGRSGFITCSERFNEYFKFESLPAIFSSTLLPYEIASLDTTLTIIQRDQWRRERLHDNAQYIREHLDDMGYNLNDSQTQIVSLEAGTEQQTIVLRDALESRGIFGAAFIAPATPKNRSLIRFSLHCNLTDKQLKKIVDVCYQIREEVDMFNWPSTRRKQNRDKVQISAENTLAIQAS